jgi:nucleoside-diphosphate-sugar epimerase
VLELAERIWKKIRGDEEFRFKLVPPLEYDVQKRVPDTTRAKTFLGFSADITLDESLDEVITWMKARLKK